MKYFKKIYFLTWLIAIQFASAFEWPLNFSESYFQSNENIQGDGIRFSCNTKQFSTIESGMDQYLASLKIPTSLIVKKIDNNKGTLLYTLNTPVDDTNTLNFKRRAAFQIHDDTVLLPTKSGKDKKILTVSKKEILLALLQHGRLTSFNGDACNIEALQDHVAIRQNMVAWAQTLNWIWPDGDHAEWNAKYWERGTPKPGVPIHAAFNDAFMNQNKYSIGCYTATKIVVAQGLLDYYRRIKKSNEQFKLVEDRLMQDHDPLVHIEPARMWDFEKDFDPKEINRAGKLVKIINDVKPNNFVPGDWSYFLNTDPLTYEKTGYEGSNSIYLGRNKFDDYYNDNNHSYSYFQKLDEVYQWRNGVFSRSRDFKKIKPLSKQDIVRLSAKPAQGGLLKSIRVAPFLFAFEQLPEMGNF